MKAKEKAQQLVVKIQVEEQKEHIYLFHMTLESAKRSALIAVDEILGLIFLSQAEINYWQEVKHEINQL
jgi:hypothetical protein